MEIRRTANAGCLLTLDHVKILLDGVCREEYPYLATPPAERAFLSAARPDAIAFTHAHRDHFDPQFDYPGGVPILGTAEISAAFPGHKVVSEALRVGNVSVTPVLTRHMGKASMEGHFSFVLQGSKCVWFMGDASPLALDAMKEFPGPDVLIAPYPYASSPAAIRKVHMIHPDRIVLVHLPLKERDPEGLWPSVASAASQLQIPMIIPDMGQSLFL